ncbi:MAG TPA: hypothetical protein VEF76_10085 [Patescibacteria group bacterium]|nr:hypothetical protein [Patescibacteria group bacterium]
MAYNSYTTARDQALADDSVPKVLKDLATRIIPEKRLEDFKALVYHGDLEPQMTSAAHPLISALSQVLAMPDKAEQLQWLKALFDQNPDAMKNATVSAFGSAPNTSIDAYNDRYRSYPVEQTSFLRFLVLRSDITADDVAALSPALLSEVIKGRDEALPAQALMHHINEAREIKVATLDRLAELTDGDDFLLIKNARGETLFHRVAAQPGNGDAEDKIDMASWMLKRRPQLLNESDRFGWTALDRLVSRSKGAVDTGMGRLLLSQGAKLSKQISPGFNLKAQLAENEGLGFGKPNLAAPRLPGASL